MAIGDRDVKARVAGVLVWAVSSALVVAIICFLGGEPDSGDIVTACAMSLLGFVTFGQAACEALDEVVRLIVLLLVTVGFMATIWYAVYGNSDERFTIVILGGFLYIVGLLWNANS